MKEHRFVVCIDNKGYEASLEFGKIYQVVIDKVPAAASPAADAADLNVSGTVTTADFGILRSALGTVPGPSALAP